jgi:hypothetical protein
MKTHKKYTNLDYLKLPPKIINYRIVAGPPNAKLSILQDHDVIFDKYDLKIRKLDTPENLDRFDEIDRLRKERGL